MEFWLSPCICLETSAVPETDLKLQTADIVGIYNCSISMLDELIHWSSIDQNLILLLSET